MVHDDIRMRLALDEAEKARLCNEVPIGAVIYDPSSQMIVSRAGNAPIGDHDPTAHAEIKAIRAACQALGNYRLTGLWLYVTLEPCPMCAGAISQARLARVIYGASDPKGGGVEHGPKVFEQPTCHHRPEVTSGVLSEDCGDILRTFFKAKRGKN